MLDFVAGRAGWYPTPCRRTDKMTNLDGSVLGMLVAAVSGDRAALNHLLDAMKEAGHGQEAGKLAGMVRLAEDVASWLTGGGSAGAHALWPAGGRDCLHRAARATPGAGPG